MFKFHSLDAVFHLSQHNLLKKLSFLPCIFLPPSSYSNWPNVLEFISRLCPVPLIDISVFVPVPYCFNGYSFVVYSKVYTDPWFLILPAPFFFVKIALYILGLLCFCTHLICCCCCSSFQENAIGNLTEIVLNLYIPLCSIVILTILVLSIQEHGYLSICCVIFAFFHQVS